jgi:hypothetical protein
VAFAQQMTDEVFYQTYKNAKMCKMAQKYIGKM